MCGIKDVLFILLLNYHFLVFYLKKAACIENYSVLGITQNALKMVLELNKVQKLCYCIYLLIV